MRMIRVAFFGQQIVVVFGATEYMIRRPFRLFHRQGNMFDGVAYRTESHADGSETWTPGAFRQADLQIVRQHIPSLLAIDDACPTLLEMSDAELEQVTLKAQPPRRVTPSLRRPTT
jgi:hypothetical protein